MKLARIRAMTSARIRATFLAGALFVALAACDDPSHVYPARTYRVAADCLDVEVAIDVVPGGAPQSNCPAVCLVDKHPPDGEVPGVFVSTYCEPYPPLFDRSGASPECKLAMDAYARGAYCGPDGGSKKPREDAGADAGGGADVDATTAPDAGAADATVDAAADAPP